MEYAFDLTVNYIHGETDIQSWEWYPSLEICLVALRQAIEAEPKATSFAIGLVQRHH